MQYCSKQSVLYWGEDGLGCTWGLLLEYFLFSLSVPYWTFCLRKEQHGVKRSFPSLSLYTFLFLQSHWQRHNKESRGHVLVTKWMRPPSRVSFPLTVLTAGWGTNSTRWRTSVSQRGPPADLRGKAGMHKQERQVSAEQCSHQGAVWSGFLCHRN